MYSCPITSTVPTPKPLVPRPWTTVYATMGPFVPSTGGDQVTRKLVDVMSCAKTETSRGGEVGAVDKYKVSYLKLFI